MIWVTTGTTDQRRHISSGPGAVQPPRELGRRRWKPPWICPPGPPGVPHAAADVLKGVGENTNPPLLGPCSALTITVGWVKNTLPEVCAA